MAFDADKCRVSLRDLMSRQVEQRICVASLYKHCVGRCPSFVWKAGLLPALSQSNIVRVSLLEPLCEANILAC
jgi:hypothetical protein